MIGSKIIFLIGILVILNQGSSGNESEKFPVPKISFAPPNYVCYRTSAPLKIDGALDERDWRQARWTEDFVDIEGENRPRPRFRTRAKMLWDDNYFYVGAELEERDIWATLKERDSIIYQDNDFEVFIDPDGDTHEYYELEINAFGTVWDLLLVRPYRDGGPAIHAWDIRGLQAAVKIDGTINKPGDKDKGWTVELAFPWEVLKECLSPRKMKPDPGDQWRINFSRVEYRVNVKDGRYEKAKDPVSGRPLAEDNWVWAPTGLINIHYPEMWGYVQFSDKIVGEGREEFQLSFDQDASWALRQVYYRQKDFFNRYGRYCENIDELGLTQLKVESYQWPPEIKTTWNSWEARLLSEDGQTSLFIREDGRFWKVSLNNKM
ncbi:MAG: carbohydrate-binding family 9-like protein [Candidatus Aminicenantes bacterium]|nr:carbohydrate-binding family 9-like protein [Candidatus Aminicenantes bacterium]